ncbi:hypothetical protein C2S52_013861 [Perilla frutescens var. hirtella]|nr:hypothetical protein C2S51_016116 [Perilla frutescens var. frutescens]KAH6776300.1 hypothetical protein C2S52_013861 [Perilla frutescens var. hirtella]
MSSTDPLLESNPERATSPLLESTPAPPFEKGNDDERMDGCEPKEDATDAPFTAKRRKKTSKVWEDFKTIVDRGVMQAECIYCKHRLSMNKLGCTTHLGRHAGGCTAKMNKLRGQKKISLALATAETVASVQNFKYNQSNVREAFAHMVIVHELPFNVAEYELFNNFARTLTPHWQKISRFTLKKDCITTFELEKKKLKEELKHVDRISVTTNLWKSDQTVSYMVITGHYVDSNWNLQKRTLNFCDVPPPHTGLIMTALEFTDVFPRYQLRDSLYKSLPSEEEWKKVSVVCSFLEDFHIATELISGSEYPIANIFLPELVHIKKLLKVDEVVTRVGEETEEPNETFMQEMVKKMKKRFDKYWGSCNLLISMAATLDPRNKMKYIEWCARNVYSEVEGIELKVTVRGKLYSLYNEYVEAYKKTSIVGNSIDDQVESLPSSSGTKGK